MLADKDTDADMAKEWAAISEKYAAPEPVDVEEPDAAPANDAKGTKTDDEGERIPVSREADGKFKARNQPERAAKATENAPEASREVTPDENATPGATAAAAAQPVAAGAEQPTRDLNRAPSTWKPAARAEWDKLSPAIRAEIYRREQDFLNGRDQLVPDATFGKTLRDVISPYTAMIQAEGGTPERAVADLFRTAAIFRTGTVQQKYQAVAQIGRQFGLDLTLFGKAPAAGATPASPAPARSAAPAEFRDPRVDQLLESQNRERQAAAARDQQQTESTVTAWMNELGADGKPKREYVGDVINDMAALLTTIKQANPTFSHAQVLDTAYERAIWANPEIRALLQQRQQTELEAKRRAENQRQVAEARKAGSVNVSRRASIPSAGKPGTMEETIANTARELGFITS